MRVAQNGNVGIGTTSPAFTHGSGLQVNAATTATVRVQYNSGYATELFADSTGTNLWQLSAANLTLGTNNLERLRIDSSGNIGINSVSPTSKLYVNGDITANVDNQLGIKLNRSATNVWNGIGYSTASLTKWFVGLRETGDNNLRWYNYTNSAMR